MAESFDPYYKWLGIPPHEQPPNHYRLLAINLFETDPDVIEAAADRQMTHLRSYQTGKHSAESQKLLNQCAAARVTLLHPQKKAEYDHQLREKLARESAPQQPGTDGTSLPLPQEVLRGEDLSLRSMTGAKPLPHPKPSPAIQSAPLIDVGALSHVDRLSARRRTKKSAWLVPMAGTGVAIALALLLWFALRPSVQWDAGKEQRAAVATNGTVPNRKRASAPARPEIKTSEEGVPTATTPVSSRESPPGSGSTVAPAAQHDRWQAFDLGGNAVIDDFVRITQGRLSTRASYTGPIEITVVARAIKNSIRLRAFHGGVIWNWEDNPLELRVGRPDQHIESAAVTPLTTGTWYRLKQRITANESDVYVDDKLVFHGTDGPYIGEPTPVWLETYEGGSAFDVKSFKVTPLPDASTSYPSGKGA